MEDEDSPPIQFSSTQDLLGYANKVTAERDTLAAEMEILLERYESLQVHAAQLVDINLKMRSVIAKHSLVLEGLRKRDNLSREGMEILAAFGLHSVSNTVKELAVTQPPSGSVAPNHFVNMRSGSGGTGGNGVVAGKDPTGRPPSGGREPGHPKRYTIETSTRPNDVLLQPQMDYPVWKETEWHDAPEIPSHHLFQGSIQQQFRSHASESGGSKALEKDESTHAGQLRKCDSPQGSMANLQSQLPQLPPKQEAPPLPLTSPQPSYLYQQPMSQERSFEQYSTLQPRSPPPNQARSLSKVHNDISIVRSASFHLQTASPTHDTLESDPTLATLVTFPLFACFPPAILQSIAHEAFEVKRKRGEPVIRKGEEAAEIFFCTRGCVAIMDDGNEVTQLNAPCYFGELGILFPLKRSTAIIARTQCNFFVVTRQKLEGVISGYPEAQRLVLDFAKTKQEWWDRENKDGSTLQTNAFGAEFVHDIARENLKKLDIFASASDKLLTKVASVMTRHVIPAGTTIVRLNDDSNSIYFIVSGTVQVVGGVDSTVHAELSSGFFFGEVGVLMNLKRTANVRAKSECHIFELQKAHLNGLLKDCPGLKSALYRASIERYESFKKRCGGHLVVAVPTEETMFMVKSKRVTDEAHQPDQFDVEVGSQSLAKLSLFQGMDKSVLSELAMQMVRKTWSRNDQIITANETGNSSMYFLAAGTVDIYTEFGDLINSVSGPSAYFGEVALIEHVPRTATVKCASVCSTYELRQQDFERVMEMHPNLAFQIKETCDARMQAYLMRNVLA